MNTEPIEAATADEIPQGSTREYANVHYAARKAISDSCERCGAKPVQAALRPDAPAGRLLIDPGTGCRYSLEVGDYHPLCVPCHRQVDLVEERSACANGHEYTAENTRVNRGARVCRTCHREREAVRNKDPETKAKKREQQSQYRQSNPMTPERKARKIELQRLRRAAAKTARFEHGEAA